jgi:hypothetical protein
MADNVEYQAEAAETQVEMAVADEEVAISDATSEDLKKQGEQTDVDAEYDTEKYPFREFTFRIPGLKDQIAFNPVVSLIGIIILWGLSIWCMVDPEGSNAVLGSWRGSVTLYFTWLFIGSKAAMFFFLMYITVKYGHIKLGKKDEEPEFSTGAFFSMICK